jgi:ABC-2 type transport system permease protein
VPRDTAPRDTVPDSTAPSSTAPSSTRPSKTVRRHPLPLFLKVLRDGWRGLLGWMLALTAAMLIYLPLHRSFATPESMQLLIDKMPQGLIKALNYDLLASGAGYVQATIFGLLGFVFLTIAAVGWGAQAVGADEESGRLELTLAHAVTRSQVELERALALILRLLVLAATTLGGVLLLNGPTDLQLNSTKTVETTVVFFALTLLTGTFALAVGAFTGRRLPAIVAGAGLAVYGYILNAVGNQNADWDWLHPWSPYYWAYGNQPMLHGADWPYAALLGGCSLVLLALAVLGLNRRDVTA